jgi:hypothetical protein
VPSFNPPTFMVSPALIARAEDHDRQMNAHRTGAPSQRIYKSNQNKIGFIGELIFGEWLYTAKKSMTTNGQSQTCEKRAMIGITRLTNNN